MMRFSIAIPEPGTLRVGQEAYVSLAAGTELHRLHPSDYGSTEFNPSAGGNARFSPIRDHAGGIIPTIYAGQSFECATCEIILRCPDTPRTVPPVEQEVSPAQFAHYMHSTLTLTEDLALVDLRAQGQRRIGVNDNALLAGPRSTYPMTRAWAERIHQSCPDARGIYYSSYQWGPEFALVLFGDRVADTALAEGSSRRVAAQACHDAIYDLGQELGIQYIDI